MDDMIDIPGVLVTPLKQVANEKGGILHLLRKVDPGFNGFGEAYVSIVKSGIIKGWRRHRQMTLNLVVPVGEIEFRAIDNRSPTGRTVTGAICLSLANYQRLTIPAGVWLSFCGKGDGLNLLINVADLVHDPLEADNVPIGHPSLPDLWTEHNL